MFLFSAFKINIILSFEKLQSKPQNPISTIYVIILYNIILGTWAAPLKTSATTVGDLSKGNGGKCPQFPWHHLQHQYKCRMSTTF